MIGCSGCGRGGAGSPGPRPAAAAAAAAAGGGGIAGAPAAVAGSACPLCPQPAPRADGRGAGLPGHARPPADLTSAPGMRRGCASSRPAAPPGWARGHGAEHEEVHGAQVLLRVPAQEVALQELQSKSARGKRRHLQRAGSRVPAAPWRTPRGSGPPRAHCHMRCTRRGVRELKLSESWSGFPKIERYYWDLLVIGLVFGPQRGLNSAPTEFLTNFVSRSGQDLGWSPGRCG